MRRTTTLSLIFASLLAGIIAGRATHFVVPIGVFGVIVVLVLALVRTRLAVWVLLVLVFVAGVARSTDYGLQQAQISQLIDQKVTLSGTISDDVGVDPRGFETFKINHLVVDGRPTPGELTVYMYVLQLERGYQVVASGKVTPGYGNAVAELSYPQLSVTSRHQSWLEQLRQRFFVGMRTALPEPIASFGLGLLVGVRALIPKDLQSQLALVGLSHLVAVSGYNLTIMVAAAHRLLARFGRGTALAASLWLIGGFLAVTGASASIVRASVVAVLALVAGFYGRRFEPLVLILLAAAATAWYRPDYLTDLGWLLSFLAFFGIMVVAPAVEARLGNPKRVVAKLFIESLTAQIMTAPLILYYFSQLSVAGPFTNLIVLPLVPLAMLVSFIAGLAGMIVPAFAGWFAWPAYLVLHFMLDVVDWFARQSWAGGTMSINLAGMIGLYAFLALGLVVLKRANRRQGRQEDAHDTLLEPVRPVAQPG